MSEPPDNSAQKQRVEELAEKWRRPSNNPPRWHHYVPQFYLRWFANEKKQIARIGVATGEINVIPVKRAAAEMDFNVIELPTGEISFEIENMFASFENDAAPALRRIGEGAFPPPEKDRDALAGFLGLQFSRGRDKRDKQQVTEEWMHKFIARQSLGNPERARRRLREVSGKEPTDQEVDDLVRLVSDPDSYEVVIPDTNSIKAMLLVAQDAMVHIFNVTWSCLRFDRRLLITSDNPVHTWSKPDKNGPLFGNRGLVTSDEVRFPVDPKTMLVFTVDERQIHKTIADKWAWELNLNTIATAYRWVFAHPDHPQLDEIAQQARSTQPGGIEVNAFGERTILRRDPPS